MTEEDFQKLFKELKDLKEVVQKVLFENKSEEILSNEEACKLLKVSSRTLQNYRNKGLIKFSQIRRKITYTRSDIDNLLNENRQ